MLWLGGGGGGGGGGGVAAGGMHIYYKIYGSFDLYCNHNNGFADRRNRGVVTFHNRRRRSLDLLCFVAWCCVNNLSLFF